MLGILIGFLALALLVAGWLAFSQHGKAVDARAEATSLAADLKGTEKDLAETEETLDGVEADLSSAEATVSQQDDQLAVCALVTEVSDHNYEQVMIALRAGQDALSGDYYGVSDKMDKVGVHNDAIDGILADSGYKYVTDLWAACAPAYEPI